MPAGHGLHAKPSTPKWPAVQMQRIKSSLPGGEELFAGHALQSSAEALASPGEYLPAAHNTHGEEPRVDLKVPLAQARHAENGGKPVYPRLQRHCEMLLLPSGECEAFGHTLHVASEVAEILDEYLPALHSTQPEDPLAALCVPGAQLVHGPPLTPEYPGKHTHCKLSRLPGGDIVLSEQLRQVALASAANASE